jgi:hypothetical protein
MDFININNEINFDQNCWELNPHLIYITPYSELYALDNGGVRSSKMMWTIIAQRYPDEKANKFFRFGDKKIREMLSETYLKDVDKFWKDDLYKKCLESFPHDCLNSIQRSVLMKKKSLVKRGEFLDSVPYNLETMSKLDLAHSKSAKIYDEYDKLEERFLKSQAEARVKGGRKQSKAEKKEI